MDNVINLTAKTVTKDFGDVTVVKAGGKIRAKINHPNKYHKDFVVESNGIALYRDTLVDALELVRSNVQGWYQSFGHSFTVTIEVK